MAKVEVFCFVKKKVVKVDSRLADALVKMKRASYDLQPSNTAQTYKNRMMTTNPAPATQVDVVELVTNPAPVVELVTEPVTDALEPQVPMVETFVPEPANIPVPQFIAPIPLQVEPAVDAGFIAPEALAPVKRRPGRPAKDTSKTE